MTVSKSSALSYLKRKGPSDEVSVNRLLVSSFVRALGISIPRSVYLSSFIIKAGDEDYASLDSFCKVLMAEYSGRLGLETLVQLFEFVVSPADRIVSGAVYTPQRIRRAIISHCIGDKTEVELRNLRIADISCGCGGFLMDVAMLIHENTGKSYSDIYSNNIFGVDIQSYAIERTKILLSLLALLAGEDESFEFNLLCRDSLDFKNDDWDTNFKDYDVIVGNPPYVCSRNLTPATREKLDSYEVCSTGHPDLYIPFFQIAIEMLNDSGRVGYITMNTFLRSINGRALRHYFSNCGYSIRIIDFRGCQIFESRNTYTCLFYLDKSELSGSLSYAVDERGEMLNNAQYHCFDYVDLDDIKGWNLNRFEETRTLESAGIQIKDYCPSRHGIATLSNDTYIFRPQKEDDRYYYLERSGELFPIEKSICRNVINPNKLHAISEFENQFEILIFPYGRTDDKITIIEPAVMMTQYPQTWRYLLSRREILRLRDKGDVSDYPQWYAYGRTQSLKLPKYKLFFPKFANQPLNCLICNDADLMFYNGMAFVSDDIRRLSILKLVIESDIFWDYISANGKPYASGYYSLSGVDIKHFGIPQFTVKEEDELLSIYDREDREIWLRRHYGLEM